MILYQFFGSLACEDITTTSALSRQKPANPPTIGGSEFLNVPKRRELFGRFDADQICVLGPSRILKKRRKSLSDHDIVFQHHRSLLVRGKKGLPARKMRQCAAGLLK